jgi:triacylglycerol lipase
MKQVPAPESKADLDALLPDPGNDGYKFFEDAKLYPFEKTLEFRHVNACWLIDCSYLSYATNTKYPTDQLQQAGLTAITFGFERSEPPHLVVAHDENVVIIAFRGTRIQDLPDILADISFLPEVTRNGLVHTGFQRALQAGGVWEDAQRYIRDILGNQVIWFTGHSLGAALSTLARRNYRDPRGRQHALYTCGSPRVGDQLVYCTSYPGNDYRIVNDEDLVTHIPTPPLYGHVGTPYTSDGKPLVGSFWEELEHRFSDVAAALGVFSYNARRGRLREYFDQQSCKPIGDHAPKAYAAKLWNSLAR